MDSLATEANGFQVMIARSLRTLTRLPVHELDPGSKSKLSRAVPAIEMAAAGGIYLPHGAVWVGDYLGEMTGWTAQDGERDNQVDCTAYAVSSLAERYSCGTGEPLVLGQRAW